jgi:hypothetical protein
VHCATACVTDSLSIYLFFIGFKKKINKYKESKKIEGKKNMCGTDISNHLSNLQNFHDEVPQGFPACVLLLVPLFQTLG